MSAISPVNRIPTAGMDEHSSTQPAVPLAERMAEAGAEPPKKKKPVSAEGALPAVTAPPPEPSPLPWGLRGVPVAAAPTGAPLAPGQQVPVHPAAAEPPATAVHAGAPVAPLRQSALPSTLAAEASTVAEVSGRTEPGERRAAPVATATLSSDTSPARGPALASAPTTAAQLPVMPATAEVFAGRREHAEAAPASASHPVPLAVPGELAGPGRASLPMPAAPATSMPALPAAPAAPVPSAPVPPAAPAPSMTVAFQSWGLGHQVHAQWVPAGVVLTPSSDRVGQALTSATLEGTATAEGELWRVEQVDPDREQRRQRFYDDPERETP